MTEQPEKKQNKQPNGYIFILLGVIGIGTRFIGEPNWSTIGIIKLGIGIICLAFGLWTVLMKKK